MEFRIHRDEDSGNSYAPSYVTATSSNYTGDSRRSKHNDVPQVPVYSGADISKDIATVVTPLVIANIAIAVSSGWGTSSNWFFLATGTTGEADCYVSGISPLNEDAENGFIASLAQETGGIFYGRSTRLIKAAYGLLIFSGFISFGNVLTLLLLPQVHTQVSQSSRGFFTRWVMRSQFICTLVMVVAPVLLLVHWSITGQVISCVQQMEAITITGATGGGTALDKGTGTLEDEHYDTGLQAYLVFGGLICHMFAMYFAVRLNSKQ